MPHHTNRKCDFPAVPRDYAHKLIGHRVHLSWAYAGANWTLKSIDGDTAHLITPLTGKPLIANVADLCFTKRQHELYEDSIKPRFECQECGTTFKLYHEGQARDRCRSCRRALKDARQQNQLNERGD